MQDYERGGLKMIDIERFILSLKVGWIKRLAQTDVLKYLSILNSIPKAWKRQLKNENQNIQPDVKIIQMIEENKLTNSYIYKTLMQRTEINISKPREKWNSIFSNENLNWRAIYLVQKSTNDIRLRNFQYKHLMRIIPTNQFLTKCHITSSTLCDFCNMEI